MNLGMSLSQQLNCTACGESMSDHADDCPQGQMERLADSVRYYSCPTCNMQFLRVNIDDAFECQKCGALWCSGMGFGEPPADAERTFIIDYYEDRAFEVYRLPGKGKGVFKETAAMKILAEQIKTARKTLRKRKAAERRAEEREEEEEERNSRMIQSYMTVNPRFTPGSPAQVRQQIAEQVMRGEKEAIEHCRDGTMGADLADKAMRLGLSNIVLHVQEYANRWVVCDQLTGEVWERLKKYKKGARVEVWDERVGWVSAKVERSEDYTTIIVRDDQQPWEKTSVDRLSKLRLKSSVKVSEPAI